MYKMKEGYTFRVYTSPLWDLIVQPVLLPFGAYKQRSAPRGLYDENESQESVFSSDMIVDQSATSLSEFLYGLLEDLLEKEVELCHFKPDFQTTIRNYRK